MANVICKECGYTGKAKKITKGSIFIELILWICFFIPGLLYSIWRLTTRSNGCPKCKHQSVIPIDSPVAKKLLADIQKV